MSNADKINRITYRSISLVFAAFLLLGCGGRNMVSLKPEQYTKAADYAYDLIGKSWCTGNVDRVLGFPAGDKYEDHNKAYKFVASNASAHCSLNDFTKSMVKFCSSKKGVFDGGWCTVDSVPLFRIDEFSTLEKSNKLNDEQWYRVAIANGFTNEKIEKERNDKDRLKQEKINKRLRLNIDAAVGDEVCKYDEDYTVDIYFSVIFRGRVEDKTNGKYKVRIFFHGNSGRAIIDTGRSPIVWTPQVGWFDCAEIMYEL
ncbi:hypothetical protein [Serratia liquefaciens]|uniref:hypothetical protein n=1 Tax=Serratia liquefaciens TaxID=614 RepID=UPI00301C7193